MDNQSFRNLLASGSGSASGAGSATGVAKRSFGSSLPKRTTLSAEDKESFKKPAFKPRNQKHAGKESKKAPAEGAYRDRAADRRLGRDNEFTAVETLLDDFNARSQSSEHDALTLAEQSKYLGGDAEHSILVKGLDIALANRNRLSSSGSSLSSSLTAPSTLLSAAAAEEALDLALSLPSLSSNLNNNDDDEDGPPKKKKRTRDELVADLRAARESGAASHGGGAFGSNEEAKREEEEVRKELERNEKEAFKAAKKEGRFKPIGFVQSAKKGSAAKGASVGGDGEAKKRRKKKVDSLPAGGSAGKLSKASEQAVVLAIGVDDDVDGDDDIFGGVSEYKGLASDSDSNDENDRAPPLASTSSAPSARIIPSSVPASTSSRNYFDEDEDDRAAHSTSGGAPSAIAHIAAAAAAEANRARNGGADDDDAAGGMMKGGRLQGLSGGRAIDASVLLEYDRYAEIEEKRKERKLKFNAPKDGEEKRKVMSEAEKLNRDYQALERYMDKKDAGASKANEQDADDDGRDA